ncbi:MAG: cytochrome C [Nitrosomonadales bacterium]|nr:cytochrome C [Nitrosomonadales bacterium]
MKMIFRSLALAGLLLAFLPLQAQANKLLMPGEVIQGHAKEEEACEKCHKKFDKAAQNRLCTDCHKDVGKDVSEKRGYHGRIEEGKDCKECHTDHKGRDAKIVILDKNAFDHAKTDFALKGKHADTAKVKCEDCHKQGKKYSEAPGKCVECHKKDDDKAHKGKLGSDCAKCHSEKDWKTTSVDHDKFDFKLRGKHEDVKCDKCHLDNKFKETPKQCASCHKKDDEKAHKGKLGNKCETCHVDRDWKEVKFDHDKLTKYPLLGKHVEVKCAKCHVDNKFKDTPKQCSSCHKKEDDKAHKGKFGNKCESCHVEKDWKEIKFDHGKTKFPLLGKHADPKLKCTGCHKGDIYKDKLPTDCFSCHEKDDKHKGQEGKKCESCHGADSWTKTTFDHNKMSTFPLLGRHILVSCKKCHATPTFKDAKSDCWSCHEKEDAKVHKRRFGTECQDCHNTRDWMAWDFNHDKTDFKLGGAHKKVANKCYSCHAKPMDKKVLLTKSCSSCHDRDDVHNGSFGDRCERCHEGDNWKQVKMGVVGADKKPLASKK